MKLLKLFPLSSSYLRISILFSHKKAGYLLANLDQELDKILSISVFFNGKLGHEFSITITITPYWILVGLLCLAFFWHGFERAQAFELTDDIQVHGFLTQGFFLTSDNRIFGSSDTGGSFDFTEAGLNAYWTPTTDLRLAAQILFRRAGVGHAHDLDLDFGVIDYTALSTDDYFLGLSLGRFKIPFGLYNDTRDVIFTRPTILLPQSIYLERTRDLAVSADGGLLHGEYRNNWGNLFLEFGLGIPRGGSLESELATLGQDYPGSISPKISYSARLTYDLEGGKYRVAITSARVKTRYDPKYAPPDDLPELKDIFKPVIFSAQYNTEKLSLTAEYAVRRFEETADDGLFNLDLSGESYYLQALYRFDPHWQAIIRYDVYYKNRDDKDGQNYQALTGKPHYTQYAKDWTFGLRYNINSSFLIAGEYHYVDGTAWLPLQDNPDPDSLEQRWHMFSLAAGYRF